jgi:penicillin-binding protein 1C
MICDILSDNASRTLGFRPGTLLNTKFPAMFKTGTSNQFNNVWALGATVNYTVGVWIGNFSGETVVGQMGNSLPVYICIDALNILMNNDEMEKFHLPKDIKEVSICPLSGQAATENCPSKITEYFKKDAKIPDCEFHVKEGNKVVVNYPVLFSGWLAKGNQGNINFKDQTNAIFPKILRPNNNSVFYVDPNIPEKNQAIRVEIINNDKNEILSLFVNGVLDKKISYPYLYYFQLKRGTSLIEVAGKNNRDKIEISVK